MWRVSVALAWLLVIIVRLLEPRRVLRGANGCYFSVTEDPDA